MSASISEPGTIGASIASPPSVTVGCYHCNHDDDTYDDTIIGITTVEMEKTVIVIAANSLSQASSGHTVTFELSPGKTKMPSTRSASKTLWTTYVEAMTEYCRVVFDIFPDKYQVCVAAVDEQKCQPVNSWRDEDQELSKVLLGLQKFGAPQSFPSGAPGYSHLSSSLQGLHYGVKCLAQLTATQYAMSSAGSLKPPLNQGRILFFSTLKSAADVKELERAVTNTIKSENADIKQKMDSARLPIHHCQLVIINTHTPPLLTSDIKDAPLTQHSAQFSSVVYSFPAKILLEKCVSLAKLHFNLKTTVITGIPMKPLPDCCESNESPNAVNIDENPDQLESNSASANAGDECSSLPAMGPYDLGALRTSFSSGALSDQDKYKVLKQFDQPQGYRLPAVSEGDRGQIYHKCKSSNPWAVFGT
eukprot:Em0001g1374a